MNAVLEVELAILKLELYMQAFLNADLHLDWRVQLGFFLQILDNEFFFFCNFLVLLIHRHVDEVADTHHDSVI